METHQAPCDSPDDEYFVPNKLDELQSESLVTGEGTSMGTTKRQYWVVQLRNGEGEVKERPMRVRDINPLPDGEKIIIPFDGHTPSGTDIDGLLGGFLGKLAQNHKNFPISFDKWPDVPSGYKDAIFHNIIKKICAKNAENRTKLSINHTGGSKKLKRRMTEIVSQTGQPVSRANLYIDTHKRTDGTYISEEARVVCEKIVEIESQGNAPVQISPNDSLRQVFGNEHSGRVRAVGDGVCPSQVFGSTNPRFSASSSSCFNSAEQNRVIQLGNHVQNLTNELKAKDEKFKKIDVYLAQLFTNSSMVVPPDLVTSLDNIQTPGGHPSSQSETNHL